MTVPAVIVQVLATLLIVAIALNPGDVRVALVLLALIASCPHRVRHWRRADGHGRWWRQQSGCSSRFRRRRPLRLAGLTECAARPRPCASDRTGSTPCPRGVWSRDEVVRVDYEA